MHRNRTILLAAALAAGGLLGACGGDDPPDPSGGLATSEPAPADAASVTAERSRFGPRDVTVTAGGEVTFENLDAAAHTVTSSEGTPLEFDSGDLAQGEVFVQQFDEPGTYGYFCEIHPTMKGTVVVE